MQQTDKYRDFSGSEPPAGGHKATKGQKHKIILGLKSTPGFLHWCRNTGRGCWPWNVRFSDDFFVFFLGRTRKKMPRGMSRRKKACVCRTRHIINPTDKKQVSALAGGPDAAPLEARNSSLYAPKIATAPGRPARMKITVRFKISFPRSFSG